MSETKQNLPPLVVVTGPTAVGKSGLALDLALQFNGEIVGADSRQIYREMDIATAKPSLAEMAQVPHHLIDQIPPDEDFSLADYQLQANAAIRDIQARRKLPLLVGGTLLYINAICEGWEIPEVAPDLSLRQAIEQEAQERGVAALYAELQSLDPEAAAHIVPTNLRRIVRALEVYRSTGQLFSQLQSKRGSPYRLLKLALTLDRDRLYAQADQRIDRMFERGLVKEVQSLLSKGYAANLPSMTGLGYSQVSAYLRGEMTLDEARQKMKFATHAYIRRQYVWLRRDPSYIWLDVADPDHIAKAQELVARMIDD